MDHCHAVKRCGLYAERNDLLSRVFLPQPLLCSFPVKSGTCTLCIVANCGGANGSVEVVACLASSCAPAPAHQCDKDIRPRPTPPAAAPGQAFCENLKMVSQPPNETCKSPFRRFCRCVAFAFSANDAFVPNQHNAPNSSQHPDLDHLESSLVHYCQHTAAQAA